MRNAFASLFLAALAGCGFPQPAPDVDRIEMRLSGWTGVDIALNRQRGGRFHVSETDPAAGSGSLPVTPQQFDRLRDRLEPFRRQAVPWSEESALRFIDQGCPEGVPSVTDAGAIYVRWRGSGTDQHYLADLGCDPERNAARNRELSSILYSLPVPLEWWRDQLG